MDGCNEFSVKNSQKRLMFHFQNDRSGRPVLTFGKGPVRGSAQGATDELKRMQANGIRTIIIF